MGTESCWHFEGKEPLNWKDGEVKAAFRTIYAALAKTRAITIMIILEFFVAALVEKPMQCFFYHFVPVLGEIDSVVDL